MFNNSEIEKLKDKMADINNQMMLVDQRLDMIERNIFEIKQKLSQNEKKIVYTNKNPNEHENNVLAMLQHIASYEHFDKEEVCIVLKHKNVQVVIEKFNRK